jgi:hypothetical protein
VQPRLTKDVIPIRGDAENLDGAADVQELPEQPKKSKATLLVEMLSEADLFHDLDGEAYARFPVCEDVEPCWHVARVRSKPFRRWLAQRFYRTYGKVPAAQAQQDALGIVEAKCIFDGDKRPVHVRVAEHDGRIYIDLCNGSWQVVEIDKAGQIKCR